MQERLIFVTDFFVTGPSILQDPLPEKMASYPGKDEGVHQNQEFVRLFAQNSRQIYAYVCSLVPLLAEADDLYQETSIVLWQNFDRYEPGTNFGAWATRVAYFQVMAYRKRKQSSKLEFSQEFIEAVALDATEGLAHRERERKLLQDCLQKLRPKDSRLIRLRYELGKSIKALASHIGRPVGGVYKSLARIETALLDCVRHERMKPGMDDQ